MRQRHDKDDCFFSLGRHSLLDPSLTPIAVVVLLTGCRVRYAASTVVGEYDVLCGRGGKTNLHYGNRLYRCVVRFLQGLFPHANTNAEDKRKLAEFVIQELHYENGTRFLVKNKGEIRVMTPLRVVAKVMQCYREEHKPGRFDEFDVALKQRIHKDASRICSILLKKHFRGKYEALSKKKSCKMIQAVDDVLTPLVTTCNLAKEEEKARSKPAVVPPSPVSAPTSGFFLAYDTGLSHMPDLDCIETTSGQPSKDDALGLATPQNEDYTTTPLEPIFVIPDDAYSFEEKWDNDPLTSIPSATAGTEEDPLQLTDFRAEQGYTNNDLLEYDANGAFSSSDTFWLDECKIPFPSVTV